MVIALNIVMRCCFASTSGGLQVQTVTTDTINQCVALNTESPVAKQLKFQHMMLV